ncbi:pseudaminic acid cytidylyltransferase [Rhodospira trueperi]|uniref:N-acylneuraminate cytidylyltransferase n=1 Tax=Rhodospira trueperi TaxID=69960 RepID=A0A1G6ZFF2_9PROT|nr:pseudaminic acid cytidylyltransferase [Rhodospira trueperi]SDE00585.1 N-acylneuraminate cytidylyltransferase [Rhodospira trueperi]
MTRLAVIPARGGSKRIPRKNIRPFCGKPMIAWSIEAALKSDCFDAVIVSTDDDEIADVARAHGAAVPFRRPAELANDHVVTGDVMSHAIEAYAQGAEQPSYVCCIYATAPFVVPDDLRGGYERVTAEGVNFAFSVTTFAFPIQRALRLLEDGGVAMFQPEHEYTRSQDLEPAYHDAGQFYWGRAEAWLSQKSVFAPWSVPIVLPRYRVQDIDTEEDWEVAERLFALTRERVLGG